MRFSWQVLLSVAGVTLALSTLSLTSHADPAASPQAVDSTVRFGTMQVTEAGKSEFREASTVPSSMPFGVQVVRTDDSPYRMLIVITAPESLANVQGGLIADESGDASVVATQALVYRGTVARVFTLDPDDPRGPYRLDVYVDGAKVGSGEINLVDQVAL